MTRLILAVALSLVACTAPVTQATKPTEAVANPTADLGYLAVATPTATPVHTATPVPTTAPTVSVGAGYRIQIPRLGINLPIVEGDAARDVLFPPEGVALHWPGSAQPGGGGNSFIYAHARVGMFLTLWNAHVGDLVQITTPRGGEIDYRVTEIHPRVDTRDVSWLRETTSPRLTLQTSTGPNATDPKFVVIAVPD